MVLINGVKYACERCIRGHRVTTCNHTDQPLMMIKPKGRPSTTCDLCKELRKNKKAVIGNAVCTCGRLEKKRLAQKAKEEAKARSKAMSKEKRKSGHTLAKNYVNGANNSSNSNNIKYREGDVSDNSSRLILSGNSSRRASLASNNSTFNKKLSSINTSAFIGDVASSATSPLSMDRRNSYHSINFTSNNTPVISSNNHNNSYLDSGKVSKDYHRVPSMVSISSLQSSQSFDTQTVNTFSSANNFSLPQSPSYSTNNFITSNPFWSPNSESNATSATNNLNGASSTAESLYKYHSESKTNLHANTTVVSPAAKEENDRVSIPANDGYDPTANRMHAESSNGLMDMFLDTSSISALSKANLLLQEKDTTDRTKSIPVNNNVDLNLDIKSAKSVEVFSITPSFMDIPEKDVNMVDTGIPLTKQRSYSLNNKKFNPNTSILSNVESTIANDTIDPVMMSNSFAVNQSNYNLFDLSSFNSQPNIHQILKDNSGSNNDSNASFQNLNEEQASISTGGTNLGMVKNRFAFQEMGAIDGLAANTSTLKTAKTRTGDNSFNELNSFTTVLR